jgi:phage shock protein A
VFDDLRSAFRQAVDNFINELDKDDVGESVDRLLKGMISEVTDAKAHLAGLDDQLEKTEVRLAQETSAASTCRRREEMARDIDDHETARVAAEHAVRHEERARVLEQRREAITAEIALARRDVAEMTEKLKEARGRRASLEAEVGRTSARESLSETDRLFAEFDRFEERLDDEGVKASAAEDLAEEYRSDLRIDPDAPIERRDVDYDAVLEELKRRMKDQ